jgi:hypothetical protein
MVHNQDTFEPIEEERLQEAPSGLRVQAQGEADLLLDADISHQARLPSVQDTPEKDSREDRGRLLGQRQRVQEERTARLQPRRETLPDAKEERLDEGEGAPGLEGDDGVQGGAS